MRLPQHIIDSLFFTFETKEELILSFGTSLSEIETQEINRLVELRLPPITSNEALAVMLGVNPGMVWSFINRTSKHYRNFLIKHGEKVREIQAPRVSLKVVQKWLSSHFQALYTAPDHVFGFIPGKSYIDAAELHCSADWVYSFDIENFFPNTKAITVFNALKRIGYSRESSLKITSLCTLKGSLVQGAPTSPVLSNIAFESTDGLLKKLADQYNLNISRYADDIVFSGRDLPPNDLKSLVCGILEPTSWRLSERKSKFSHSPNRLKVHGLLVNGPSPKLTKGYRNKIRAYQHMINTGKVKESDLNRLNGHIHYGNYLKSRFDH